MLVRGKRKIGQTMVGNIWAFPYILHFLYQTGKNDPFSSGSGIILFLAEIFFGRSSSERRRATPEFTRAARMTCIHNGSSPKCKRNASDENDIESIAFS